MENRDSNRVNMIRATKTFCSANTAPTAGIAAFAPLVATVGTKITLIDGLDQVAMGSTSGVTLDTKAIRKAMTDLAFKCGSALTAYASSVNNNTLKAKVKYTETNYKEFKKEEVDDICQTIRDEANTNILAAGPFGYVALDVTDLQTAINLYRTSIQNPRQAIISKKSANEQIKNLIRQIIDDIFVNQMDKMVNTLKATQPVFLGKYFDAREVIDIGSTTAKVRGTTTDVNDNTLNGVTFKIKTTGTANIIAQTTSANGGKFGISNIPVGDYDFSWELTGYVTQTETNVHIAAGKELKRKIKLATI